MSTSSVKIPNKQISNNNYAYATVITDLKLEYDVYWRTEVSTTMKDENGDFVLDTHIGVDDIYITYNNTRHKLNLQKTDNTFGDITTNFTSNIINKFSDRGSTKLIGLHDWLQKYINNHAYNHNYTHNIFYDIRFRNLPFDNSFNVIERNQLPYVLDTDYHCHVTVEFNKDIDLTNAVQFDTHLYLIPYKNDKGSSNNLTVNKIILNHCLDGYVPSAGIRTVIDGNFQTKPLPYYSALVNSKTKVTISNSNWRNYTYYMDEFNTVNNANIEPLFTVDYDDDLVNNPVVLFDYNKFITDDNAIQRLGRDPQQITFPNSKDYVYGLAFESCISYQTTTPIYNEQERSYSFDITFRCLKSFLGYATAYISIAGKDIIMPAELNEIKTITIKESRDNFKKYFVKTTLKANRNSGYYFIKDNTYSWNSSFEKFFPLLVKEFEGELVFNNDYTVIGDTQKRDNNLINVDNINIFSYTKYQRYGGLINTPIYNLFCTNRTLDNTQLIVLDNKFQFINFVLIKYVVLDINFIMSRYVQLQNLIGNQYNVTINNKTYTFTLRHVHRCWREGSGTNIVNSLGFILNYSEQSSNIDDFIYYDFNLTYNTSDDSISLSAVLK